VYTEIFFIFPPFRGTFPVGFFEVLLKALVGRFHHFSFFLVESSLFFFHLAPFFSQGTFSL